MMTPGEWIVGFYNIYEEQSYVILQKARILFWFNFISSLMLTIVSILNLTTSLSTYPIVMATLNMIVAVVLLFALGLLRFGHYNSAIFLSASFITVRVLFGMITKIETIATLGSNNDVYYIFIIMTFIALFGTRLLLTIMTVCMTTFIWGLVIAAKSLYNPSNINYFIGTTINVTITIMAVFCILYLISVITERSLKSVEGELVINKQLSGTLEVKVQELQGMYEEMEAMYEEMETMNEDLEVTSQELMNSNEKLTMYKRFVDASTQGFVMADLDGVLIYGNQAVEDLVCNGFFKTVIGEKWYAFCANEEKIKLQNDILPQVFENKKWSGEIPVIAGSGEIIMALLNLFLIEDGKGEPLALAAIVTDLSELKELESQLIHGQKMQAIGRLAGGIAHDFNNYLTAIIGYSGLLLSQVEGDYTKSEEIKEILKAAERSASLTRQLLTFSKREMLRPIVLNVNNEIKDMEKLLRRIIGENIDLITTLEEPLNSVRMDAVHIEQVILNCAVNARDAMPGGGKLIIKTENKVLTKEDCKGSSELIPGPYVCLTIEDTGCGIDKENLDKIFEPFFTTKKITEGSGLGLSVVFGIVKQHKGVIDVDTAVNEGSKFSIYFPALMEEADKREMERIPLDDLTGNGERILLVEDQDEVRNFAFSALTKNGYAVVQTGTAAEALEIFRKENGAFDLVFSDLVLPDENGIDLISNLRQEKGDITVLLCSGYMDKDSHYRQILEEKYPFLMKPYTLYELLESIHQLLNG